MSNDPAKIRQAFENFKHRFQWRGTLEETLANPLAAAMLRALANSTNPKRAASSGAVAGASQPVAMGLFTNTAEERGSIARPVTRNWHLKGTDRKRLAGNDRDD